jgi:hypothetical protein
MQPHPAVGISRLAEVKAKTDTGATPLVSLLVVPLLLLASLFPVLPVPPLVVMRLAMLVVIAAFFLAWCARRPGLERVMIGSVVFGLAICAVPLASKGYDSILISIVFSGLLGYLGHQYFRYPGPVLGVFIALCFYFILYYLRFGDLDDSLYAQTGGNITGASRNFVGVVLLQYYLFYYAVCVANSKPPCHWPFYAMPIICIMASGVGSAIIAVLLMFVFVLVNLNVRLAHGVLGFIVVLIAASVASRWIETSLLFERLTSGEFVVSRLVLWTDFFAKLDSHSILVGFPKDVGFIDHDVNTDEINNLHNSYLNLYRMVGAFSLLYFVLIVYVAVALFRRNRVLFLIYVASLLRASTDGYYFSSFLVDFIIFYLFMLTPLGKRVVLGARRLRQLTSTGRGDLQAA